MRRGHHVDVAVDAEVTLALLPAGIGAIEDTVMLFLKERRAFQRHRTADMIIGRLDVLFREAQRPQQVEGRIVQLLGGNTQNLRAELLSQRPLVEDKTDVEGLRQRRVHLGQLVRAETVAHQRGVVDTRRIPDGAMAHRVAHDFLDLRGAVAQLFQRRGHRLVDDLEVAAAGQLLELHQCEIRLDPRGVTIHHQTNGAGGRDDGGLRITVAVLLTQLQRLVPAGHRHIDQRGLRAACVIERHRLHRKTFVARVVAMGGVAVVADDAQHVLCVLFVSGESAKLSGHLGRGRIGHTGHDRRQRTAERAALVAVIAQPHVHQQAADIGIAKAQRAEVIGPLRDLLAGELRHHHADFQRYRPQTAGVHVVFDLKLAVLEESQQVHRRKVTGRIVEEHVFRTGVRSADRTVFGAGVPVVHGVVVLDAGIGTGPGGMAHLRPEIAGAHRLGHRAVDAVDQLPVGILFHRRQKGVGHPDGVVGVLARDGVVGFGIPVRVIGGELDAGVSLTGVIQHALHVSLWDGDLFRFADRGLQPLVLGRVIGIRLRAVPRPDGGKKLVQLFFMHLGARDDARDLLLLQHLPVDEILDIGVVGIHDHHLRRATGGAAGLDRACCAVPDLEEPHQARRLAAARQLLALSAER